MPKVTTRERTAAEQQRAELHTKGRVSDLLTGVGCSVVLGAFFAFVSLPIGCVTAVVLTLHYGEDAPIWIGFTGWALVGGALGFAPVVFLHWSREARDYRKQFRADLEDDVVLEVEMEVVESLSIGGNLLCHLLTNDVVAIPNWRELQSLGALLSESNDATEVSDEPTPEEEDEPPAKLHAVVLPRSRVALCFVATGSPAEPIAEYDRIRKGVRLARLSFVPFDWAGETVWHWRFFGCVEVRIPWEEIPAKLGNFSVPSG